MKVHLCRFTALFLFLAFTPSIVLAERLAPADFDRDGLSDFVLISSTDNVLSWSAVTGGGSTQQSLGDFGRLGFHISLGDWLGTGTPQPATVTTAGSKIVWRILNNGGSTLKEFGATGETVVAGADFSGDGTVDASIVCRTIQDGAPGPLVACRALRRRRFRVAGEALRGFGKTAGAVVGKKRLAIVVVRRHPRERH